MTGFYKSKRILGIITARSGSKGVPMKNIKKLLGKPLIAYTIEEAKKSKYLSRCIVSTDDSKIADIAKKYGAEVPFLRPASLAKDNSSSISVCKHALRWLEKHGFGKFDHVMILQPTSPLRIAKDIDECIKKIVISGADSVMSMVKLSDFDIKKIKKIKNEVITPWCEKEGKASNRRDKGGEVYKRNCAIYLTKTDCILRGDLFGKVSVAYVMPPERSVDINGPVDFEIAEFWLKKMKSGSLN